MQDGRPLEEGSSDFSTRFAAQIQRIRESDMLGRSDPLHRLFDYLSSRAGIVGPPSEFELADALGKGFSFEPGQDSSIRVYVHRLRKKLDDFYTGSPNGHDRLSIPRGTYRLIISKVGAPEQEAVEPPPAISQAIEPLSSEPATAQKAWSAMSVAAVAVVALGVIAVAVAAGYYWGVDQHRPKALAQTEVWHPLLNTPLVTDYVLGDQALEGGHPHVVLSGSVKAFAQVTPFVDSLAGGPGRPLITGSSFLVPNSIKDTNLVYIGTIAQMGVLRDVVFARSNFDPDDSGALTNKTTKTVYRSAPPPYIEHRRLVSYGYLACLSGAAGNRIIIISGATDGAVVQMAETATDPAQIQKLSAQGGPNFEALYSVATVDEANVEFHLVSVNPLR